MAKLVEEMSIEDIQKYLADPPPEPIESFEVGYFLVRPGDETYALVIGVDEDGRATLLPMPGPAPSFHVPVADIEEWQRPMTGGARLVTVSQRGSGEGLWQTYVPDMASAVLLWNELAEMSPELKLTIYTPYAWERRWLGQAGYMDHEDAESGYIIPG